MAHTFFWAVSGVSAIWRELSGIPQRGADMAGYAGDILYRTHFGFDSWALYDTGDSGEYPGSDLAGRRAVLSGQGIPGGSGLWDGSGL